MLMKSSHEFAYLERNKVQMALPAHQELQLVVPQQPQRGPPAHLQPVPTMVIVPILLTQQRTPPPAMA